MIARFYPLFLAAALLSTIIVLIAADLKPEPTVSLQINDNNPFSGKLTGDWEVEPWLSPLNLVVSQLFMIWKQPIQVGSGGRYCSLAFSGGPKRGLR